MLKEGRGLMYDIHCHVLHGLDDGARDISESMLICKAEAKYNVDTIVATPHFIEGELEVEPSSILSGIKEVEEEAKGIGLNLKILPGMEIYIVPDLVKLFEEGRILTLNNKNYMLIELPLFESIPSFLEETLFKLQLKGVKPIIAHPERSRDIMNHPNIVYRLIKKECLMQVNAGSVLGLFGKQVQKTAITLLNHNMAHAIASDMHAGHERMEGLDKCFREISKKYGKAAANDLFIINPEKIISGEDIYPEDPERVEKKKFLIFKY